MWCSETLTVRRALLEKRILAAYFVRRVLLSRN
jgi:hypothetical protein